MAVDPDFVLTFLIRTMVQKIGVSAVKIKFMIFMLFIFRMLENITALNLRGVTSQEIFSPRAICVLFASTIFSSL